MKAQPKDMNEAVAMLDKWRLAAPGRYWFVSSPLYPDQGYECQLYVNPQDNTGDEPHCYEAEDRDSLLVAITAALAEAEEALKCS
jgi:hypothetical protein